ncbi:MAG: hypothetical protein QOI98_2553 [Solirubrobacteraceae bacterium]|nr:hypothetical protein [Solirubrobacteraceae bacterium]
MVEGMRARRWGRGLLSAGLAASVTLTVAACAPKLPRLDDPPRVRVAGASCPTAPETSPKAPVLRMWCELERRHLGRAVAIYDPRVQRALGKTLKQTLEDIRRSGIYGRAEIVEVESSKVRGTTAIVHVGKRRGKVITAWYRLAPRGSGWAITWDTTLRFVLGAYLNPSDVGRQVGTPIPRPASRHSVIAAAVRRYDLLFSNPVGK